VSHSPQFNIHVGCEIQDETNVIVLADTPKGNSNVYFRDESSELATCTHLRALGIRIYRRFNEETHTVHLEEEQRNFAKQFQKMRGFINSTDDDSDRFHNARQLTSFTVVVRRFDASRLLLTDTRT